MLSTQSVVQALHNLNDLNTSINELQQLCLSALQTNQRLLEMLRSGSTQGVPRTPFTFNAAHLAIQQKIIQENRQFTSVSNILKTKHDTVKNSISNIR